MAQLNDQQKGILLFHDIHRRTAEMLPELLARLARQDYTVVLILSSDETSRYKHPFLDGSYRF
jgi:peptidoglycan/xylan/chitin deacetylase (PgdA/CDA1 family)